MHEINHFWTIFWITKWGHRRAKTRNGTVLTHASKSDFRFLSWVVLIVDISDSGGPQT